MDKNQQSAVEQFLKDGSPEMMFEQPKDNVFGEAEVITEEAKKEDEKPIPFHKDPKIRKFLEKREEEIKERILASLPKETVTQTEDGVKDVIDSFALILGNDTPEKINALNALSKSLKGLDEKAIKRAEEKIAQIRNGEIEADKKAEEELESAFDSIEENYDVDLSSNSSKASTLRKEFSTFVEKIAPKDRNGQITGYPDMNNAWETFSEIKKSTQTPSRNKELASRSIARSSEAVAVQPKKVDWNTVDDYLDSLK